MSVCFAASLAMQGDVLAYSGPDGGARRLPLQSIRVVGELTTAGSGEDHLLAVCVDAGGSWFRAPCNATGADDALAALGSRLGGPIVPLLGNSAPFASRVLWPPALADRPMFEFPGAKPRVSRAVMEYLARPAGTTASRGGPP